MMKSVLGFFVSLSQLQVRTASASAPAGFTCAGFVQTDKCDPGGKMTERKGCGEQIEAGISGYCECNETTTGKKQKRRMENCNHAKFTCEDACRRANEYTCESWVHSSKCGDTISELEEALTGQTATCETMIQEHEIGFCKCGDGRNVITGGCKKPAMSVPTNCQRVCERGPQPYEELGTHKWADAELIKKSFRKLSLKYHPDRVKPGEADRFPRLREAMDILEDPLTKSLFDTGSYDKLRKYKANELQKGDDLTGIIPVSLEQLYAGSEFNFRYVRTKICPGCKMSSKSKFCTNVCTKVCPPEWEFTYFWQGNMRYQQQNQVASKLKCREDHEPFIIKFDKGGKDGQKVVFRGESNQAEKFYPGDVIFKLEMSKNSKFERSGDHLIAKVPISFKESLLGFSRVIKHLDGHTVELKTDKLTAQNQRFRITGEGMWNAMESQFGDLVVVANVEPPPTNVLPQPLKDAIQQHLVGGTQPRTEL